MPPTITIRLPFEPGSCVPGENWGRKTIASIARARMSVSPPAPKPNPYVARMGPTMDAIAPIAASFSFGPNLLKFMYATILH